MTQLRMPLLAASHSDFTDDLLVIGSGPGGQRAAIQAAKLGKKVAVVEKQAVMAFGGTVDYFVNTVFNSPTLAECYKTAAFDGINRLGSAPLLEPKLEPAKDVGEVV